MFDELPWRRLSEEALCEWSFSLLCSFSFCVNSVVLLRCDVPLLVLTSALHLSFILCALPILPCASPLLVCASPLFHAPVYMKQKVMDETAPLQSLLAVDLSKRISSAEAASYSCCLRWVGFPFSSTCCPWTFALPLSFCPSLSFWPPSAFSRLQFCPFLSFCLLLCFPSPPSRPPHHLEHSVSGTYWL